MGEQPTADNGANGLPIEAAQLRDGIAQLGQQMQTVSKDFERLFPALEQTLRSVAHNAGTLADAASKVADSVDAAATAFRANMPNQPTLDCARSCHACCHLYVKMPPGFAELIADYVINHFSEDQLASLKEDLAVAAEKERVADPSGFGYRNPCPMLGEDRSCRIYPVRPLSCRSFTSSSRPQCDAMAFGGQTNAEIDQQPTLVGFYGIATKVLEDAATAQGLPADQQTLSVAVLAALNERLAA
ncbi:MAG: YkgJ family cysteine cluster protein [Alphaproteobacteria bacterium]|nr:YkgJ family cysteine cluster protein [Alphaproteobacteria bacterium SS10]